jgi:hypothetical protein
VNLVLFYLPDADKSAVSRVNLMGCSVSSPEAMRNSQARVMMLAFLFLLVIVSVSFAILDLFLAARQGF